MKTLGFETIRNATSVCPKGTGKTSSLTELKGLGVSPGSVFEDGTWGRVNRMYEIASLGHTGLTIKNCFAQK